MTPSSGRKVFTLVEKQRKFNGKWLLLPLGVLVLAILLWLGARLYIVLHARSAPAAYDPGVWFELAPEEAVTADGEPLAARMRVGTENKVLVLFYGGGISIDEYTAARPYIGAWIDREPGFYSTDPEGQLDTYGSLGITSTQSDNPFRDWTVLLVPYATGDFHIGSGEYAYTDLDGEQRVLYHHGYDNYRAILDEAVEYTGAAPEELLIAGWSAGGYAAAILARDLMENYFPDAGHVTVCVDSSLLILDDWTAVLRDVWNAPEELVARVRSQNLIVDFLSDLYDTYGDSVTYLYIGSVRDGALAKYQAYFDVGFYSVRNEIIPVYTNYLRGMIRQLQEKVPGIGVYLFDNLPYSWFPTLNRLTQHTLLSTRTAYWRLTAGRSAVQWLNDAVGGKVDVLGLEKLR